VPPVGFQPPPSRGERGLSGGQGEDQPRVWSATSRYNFGHLYTGSVLRRRSDPHYRRRCLAVISRASACLMRARKTGRNWGEQNRRPARPRHPSPFALRADDRHPWSSTDSHGEIITKTEVVTRPWAGNVVTPSTASDHLCSARITRPFKLWGCSAIRCGEAGVSIIYSRPYRLSTVDRIQSIERCAGLETRAAQRLRWEIPVTPLRR